MLPVEGGWSAVLQVPAVGTEEALALDLLEQDDVLVHPGYFFDFTSGAHVVVSLLLEPAAFEAGVSRVLSPRGRKEALVQSGLIVPLFSLVSSQGWGIGEFRDLAPFSRWAAEAGQRVLQILPINEMPPMERRRIRR